MLKTEKIEFNIDFRQIEEEARYVVSVAADGTPLPIGKYYMLYGKVVFLSQAGIIDRETCKFLLDNIVDRLFIEEEV